MLRFFVFWFFDKKEIINVHVCYIHYSKVIFKRKLFFISTAKLLISADISAIFIVITENVNFVSLPIPIVKSVCFAHFISSLATRNIGFLYSGLKAFVIIIYKHFYFEILLLKLSKTRYRMLKIFLSCWNIQSLFAGFPV